VLFITNRIEEAVALLEQALATHEAEGDDVAIATVSVELGRFLFFEGRSDDATPHVERALELSERLRLADVVVEALNNKALLLAHRPNESLGLMRQALVLAEEAGVPRGALRSCMNLSFLLALSGKTAEAEGVIEHGLALARRRGDRVWERSLTANLVQFYFESGQWDDIERVVAEIPEDGRLTSEPVQAAMMLVLAQMSLYRGERERVHELAAEYAAWNETANVQATNVRSWARELLAQVEGRHDDALRESISCLGDHRLAADPEAVAKFLELGCESAVFTADAGALEELLTVAAAAPIDRSPSLAARTLLQRARLAALRGEAEPRFDGAVAALRDVEEPFWVATALLEQAEWLAGHDHGEEIGPLLAEAREVFERLRAQPRLERVEQLEAASTTRSTSAPTSK
jgi:tetratricopeptide (TPR) repeat protein